MIVDSKEEFANSVSHGIGLLAALAAAPILLTHAARRGGAGFFLGVSVFIATIILLYLISTLYHALPPGEAKEQSQVIEHAAIFLLIAGTYTPFALGVLRGPMGWTLFGLVGLLASAGVVLKFIGGARYPVLSTALYLGMGWSSEGSLIRQGSRFSRRRGCGTTTSSGTCSSWQAPCVITSPCYGMPFSEMQGGSDDTRHDRFRD
jgi:channel protein (hemolysin III family)